MKIDIIETSNLGIKTSKQNIDRPLNCPKPFIDKPAIYVVSGSMGSGKSAFVQSIMTAKGSNKVFHRAFDKVHYCTPLEVFESEQDHPFKDHSKERTYHELTVGTLLHIQEQAILEKQDGGVSCMILDDFSEVYKQKVIELQLRKTFYKFRHMKLNIIITVLNLRSIPKSLRGLVDVYVVFKPSVVEMEAVNDDIFELKKEELQQLTDYVFDEPYNFLFFNQKSKTFYKKFDKLKLTKKD